MKIRIIGYGRLAKAIIQPWLGQHEITVSAPSLVQKQESLLNTTPSNVEMLDTQDCLLLAVKPQFILPILASISTVLPAELPIISLAAGICLKDMQKTLPQSRFIGRAMPNIAAEIGLSATLLYSDQAEEFTWATELFSTLGNVYWVDSDDLLDLGTILSGSGPAYIFYFMQALSQAAHQLGMPLDLAQNLIEQTVLGAVKLRLEKNLDLEQLSAQVQSPQGTTAAALAVLEQGQFKELITQALQQAWQRLLDIRRKTT